MTATIMMPGRSDNYPRRGTERYRLPMQPQSIPTCSIPDCEKTVKGRGWCAMHYARWRKFGDPNIATLCFTDDAVEARFHKSYVVKGECWVWRLRLVPRGYGYFVTRDKQWRAHRWSYERFVGPIPDGKEIDHLCRNRACVNPEHLEPVTPWENQHRSPLTNATKSHCASGHLYSPENTHEQYITKNGRRYRKRICRTCQRRNRTNYYEANRTRILAKQKAKYVRKADRINP